MITTTKYNKPLFLWAANIVSKAQIIKLDISLTTGLTIH